MRAGRRAAAPICPPPMRSLFLGSVALMAAGAAAAQDAPATPASALPDLLVTADGRERPAQSVPMAITAFSARDLEARGATDLLGVAGHVPGLIAGSLPGLGSGSALYLRGLGTMETLPGSDPAVAVVLDDIVLPGVNGNNIGFFDIERVEVARGPQSVLVGRNSTGGAISVRLKRPSENFGGFLQAGYGTDDRWLLRGSVDVPLAEIVAVKVSAYLQDDHGYAYNPITGEDLNDADRAGIRFALQLKPVDKVSWNVAFAYMEANGENLLNFRCAPANPTDCSGRTISTGMVTDGVLGGKPQYSLPITGRKANFTLGNEQSTTLITSNLEWGGEAIRLNLITGYADLTENYALDFADGRGLPDIAQPNPPVRGFVNGGRTTINAGTLSQFSQEVRLSGRVGIIDYVAGAVWLDQDSSADIADLQTMENGTATGQPNLLADRVLRSSTTAKSGYAQVSATLLEPLTLSAGIRYTDEEKRFSVAENRAACGLLPAPANCLNAVSPQTVSSKQWTPRLSLGFAATDTINLYASAARGYRAGGWNAAALRPDAFATSEAETAWSYEAGVKSLWLDGRLRLNLTGFLLNVDGLQAPMAMEDAITGAVTAVTGNATDYRNHGVELELAAMPIDGLTLGLNLTWQDDRYSVPDGLGTDARGLKSVRQQQADCAADLAAGLLPLAPGAYRAQNCAIGLVTADGSLATPVRTPDWTLALNAQWDIPVNWSGIIVSPKASLLYRSKMETDFANASLFGGASAPAFDGTVFPANALSGDFLSGSAAESLWLLNAAIEIRTDDEFWRLTVSCENCLDKAGPNASLYGYSYLNPPRSWMVSARRRF